LRTARLFSSGHRSCRTVGGRRRRGLTPTMLDAAGRELSTRLLDWFQRPVTEAPRDDVFNDLALDVFRYQFDRIPALGAFWGRRGRDPGSVRHWSQIPAVPTAAFRELPLAAGDPAQAEAVFRTSGTTAEGTRRGTHYLMDLSIYHAALLPNFAARLLPDGSTLPMFALVPPAAELPDSSLAHMLQVVIDHLGGPGSAHYVHAASGLDRAGLTKALRSAELRRSPVCLLGTSFSFVHWTDHLRETGEHFDLPEGSRLMDTGGFKGRSRTVPESELRHAYLELMGIHPDFCINEYGMTELCSQAYETSLEERLGGALVGPRRKKWPPWARTRAVDPDTLEPLPNGETGLLQHFDLANLGSVVAVQTEDLGVCVEDGFIVLGRAGTATPRGCSIAMDELLHAARDRS
ncbi:MAG: hypothetical protein ACRDHF_02720, partial [Tepidiformaceae bacterium]